ncbi:MAG: hypothetical protein JWQ35_2149 [Bacteriovoracaceae bacterium]|nr:hypothetical protein [Bacteriovoracaceae bacterium]
MSFTPKQFYRYRKNFHRAALRLGDIYQLSKEVDCFPKLKKEFILINARGVEFHLSCSYEDLDNVRLEDIFEEVPKPTWWGSSDKSYSE